MVRISVVAPAETSSITMTGLFDLIGKADRAFGAVRGRPGQDTVFDIQLVSLDGRPVRYRDRVTVNVDVAAEEVGVSDLVVVPGLDDDLAPSLALNLAWSPWLAKWHKNGSVIASSCSGAFLLAEAGLLDGRSATTHWLYADELQRRYPAVKVTPQHLVVDNGDVITSGGATTFLDLALYLVERFAGRERANAAARVLLIDGARKSQLPYVTIGGVNRDHGDGLVHQAQQLIDSDLAAPLRIETLARHVGISSRTLARHFLAAVGETPQAYVQTRRIEMARRLLEASEDPVDNIRQRVGYQDATAFRRAFRHHTGLSPTDYRLRYGWPASSLSA